MKRKNEAHELVLQCLTEALLKLMEKKPFNEISVSELCEKAGVARASFYRNYDSMQEILTNYLSSVTDEWWEEFVKYPEDEFHEKFWKELLLQYKKNEELIKLIYQNDISYIIKIIFLIPADRKTGRTSRRNIFVQWLPVQFTGLLNNG